MPASFEVTERSGLVAGLVRVSLAPTTAAPVESAIDREISAVGACAKTANRESVRSSSVRVMFALLWVYQPARAYGCHADDGVMGAIDPQIAGQRIGRDA